MEFKHLIVPKRIRNTVKHNQKVIVRFPPEPSGYLHIGHIKALYINACFSKHFDGHLIIRFDDTNPILESSEFENAIIEDLKQLNVDMSLVTYTSDYFSQLINYAEILIDKGLAYVDLTDPKSLKEMRTNGIPSEYRSEDIQTIKDRWSSLKSGKIKSGVLRLKIDMSNKNKAMRDPSMYRSIDLPHHRTGTKYKVYPTYDFACPVVDSLEGVTHVFRSAEYNERNDQAAFILENLGLTKPLFFHYGRINIKDAEISKRKIKASIADGTYSGWDDVRLYTFRALMKRGLQYPALEEFMKETGYSTVSVTIEPSKLWQINRKYIDLKSSRYMVIDCKSFKTFDINDDRNSQTILKYAKNPDLGHREIFYGHKILISEPVEESICLVNWGTKMSVINKDGTLIKSEQKTTKYIPWVTPDYVNVNITEINGVQKNNKLFYGEKALGFIKPGDYVQLIQKGYYICSENDGSLVTLISAC
jgi:glutamyl-tRNA synthetase